MNGEVVTYNTIGKLSWDAFNKLPQDIQKLYLDNLIANHKARRQDIADMFGITNQSLSNYIFRRKLGIKFSRAKKEVDPEWLCFINTSKEISEPEPEPTPVEEAKVEPSPTPVLNTDFKVENICYRAVGDPLVIFAQIAKLVEPGSRYRVNVDIWELKDMAPDTMSF